MSLRQSPRLPRLTDCWSALSHDIVALILDLGILATEQEYEAVRLRFNTAALLMCLNTSSSEAVAMWRQYLPFVYLSNPSSSALRAAARCPRIRKLQCGCGNEEVSDADWLKVAAGCSMLEEILFVTNPSRKALLGLIRQCPLRVLHFHELGDSHLGALRKLSNLEELAVDHSNDEVFVSDHGLKIIAQGCPRLRRLVLTDASDTISPDTIIKCAPLFNHLRELNLCGARFALDDESVTAIAQSCTRLEFLDIRESMCRESLDRNNNVTDVSALAMATLTLLKSLSIDGCEVADDGLLHIARSCTLIEELSIAHTRVTTTGVHTIATERLLPRLVALDMSLLDMSEETSDDAAIEAVAKNWPQLQRLDLADFYAATDAGLKPLAGLRHLAVLGIRGCDALTEASLDLLAIGFPALELLDIWHHPRQFTSKGVDALQDQRPSLNVEHNLHFLSTWRLHLDEDLVDW